MYNIKEEEKGSGWQLNPFNKLYCAYVFWRTTSLLYYLLFFLHSLSSTLTPTGHRVHHAGPGAGETTHLSQGGPPPDAGLLAERAPAEARHQGHPQPPAGPGQEPPSLPGHPGIEGSSSNQGVEITGWGEGARSLRL